MAASIRLTVCKPWRVLNVRWNWKWRHISTNYCRKGKSHKVSNRKCTSIAHAMSSLLVDQVISASRPGHFCRQYCWNGFVYTPEVWLMGTDRHLELSNMSFVLHGLVSWKWPCRVTSMRIETLPFINLDPSDPSTIYTALYFAQSQCEKHIT